jgi:hypothetical protein
VQKSQREYIRHHIFHIYDFVACDAKICAVLYAKMLLYVCMHERFLPYFCQSFSVSDKESTPYVGPEVLGNMDTLDWSAGGQPKAMLLCDKTPTPT